FDVGADHQLRELEHVGGGERGAVHRVGHVGEHLLEVVAYNPHPLQLNGGGLHVERPGDSALDGESADGGAYAAEDDAGTFPPLDGGLERADEELLTPTLRHLAGDLVEVLRQLSLDRFEAGGVEGGGEVEQAGPV